MSQIITYIDHPAYGKIKKVQEENTEPTMTQQQFKDECDVNKIIANYQKTGQLTHVARQQGAYKDLSTTVEYSEALTQVIRAQEAFDTLPVELRTRFQNDPSQLLSYLDDPNNIQESIELGIREAKPNPEHKPTLNKNKPTPKPNNQTQNNQTQNNQTQKPPNT